MKGHKEVIAVLNQLLAGELAARDQYFIHSRMYDDWGFRKLYDRVWHEMEEETEHANWLIHRILFLEGTPQVKPAALNVGKDVKQMLKNDLELELSVVSALRKAIAQCEKHEDYVTRDGLKVLLKDTEEDHTYWLEKQLGLIEQIGLQNYLQAQMGDDDGS